MTSFFPLARNNSIPPSADFDDQILSTHHHLEELGSSFDGLRALSNRLRLLPVNNFSVPTLAGNLRKYLLRASKRLVDIDSEIQLHWEGAANIRTARVGSPASGAGPGMLQERENYHQVMFTFRQRVSEINREARGEGKDDLENEPEPDALDDYLASGTDDLSKMAATDSVLPSRWAALHPFTMLARLAKGMKSLLFDNELPPGFVASSTPATQPLSPVPASTLQAEQSAMASFNQKIASTNSELDSLERQFTFMRSVRDRLRSLSPSDNGYLLIATELRDLTDEVGRLLVAINDEVEVHWDVERRFVTTFSPFRTVPFSTQNAYARREAYDGLAIRMMKEVQVVQKEAAKEDGERVRLGFASEPQGLGKYLKKGSQPSSPEVGQFVAKFPFLSLAFDVDRIKPLIYTSAPHIPAS